MATKRHPTVWFIVGSLLIGILLSACSGGEAEVHTPETNSLPGIGAFLWDSASETYSQMAKGRGAPPNSGIPATDNSLPVIGLNEGNLSEIDLYLVRGNTLDGRIELFRAEAGGRYELTPVNALSPGRYCLVEGNPQRSFYDHPWWCLDVIGNALAAATSLPDQDELDTVVPDTTQPPQDIPQLDQARPWSLVPIGYTTADQVDRWDADAGWTYLAVFFTLHNNTEGYLLSPERLGEMEASTREGYVYEESGHIFLPERLVLPPGVSVVGSSGASWSNPHYAPIMVFFRVSSESSGYSIHSADYGTISLDGVPELPLNMAHLEFDLEHHAQILKTLTQAATEQNLELPFDGTGPTVSAFGEAVEAGEDGEIELDSALRIDLGALYDKLEVQLIHHNNHGGYGKEFNVQYYVITDDGMVSSASESSGLSDEVGPGQSQPVTLGFAMSEGFGRTWLVATGEANAVYDLGTPENETSEFWRQNDIEELINLANRAQPALHAAIAANDPALAEQLFTDELMWSVWGSQHPDFLAFVGCKEPEGLGMDVTAHLYDTTESRLTDSSESKRVLDDNRVELVLTQSFRAQNVYICPEVNVPPLLLEFESSEYVGEEDFAYGFSKVDGTWLISSISLR